MSEAKPRPWFLSIALLWHEAFGASILLRLLQTQQLPADHALVPTHTMHFTVLALARFSPGSDEGERLAERGHEILRAAVLDIGRQLATAEQIAGTVYETRLYTSGSTIQCKPLVPLTGVRDRWRATLREPVEQMCARLARDAVNVTSMLDDPKNSAEDLYGSFARSRDKDARASLRGSKAVEPGIELAFSRAHLVVSNETLSNEHAVERAIQIQLGPLRE